MSGGDIDIRMSGDTQDLLRAQAKVIQQQSKMEEKLRKLLGQAKKTSRDGSREMKKFAESTTKINRSPAERYRDSINRLNQALRQGLITQQTYNRAVERLRGTQQSTFSASNIGAWTAGIASATAGVRTLLGAMREVKAESEAIAARQQESAGGLGRLGQLTGGDPAKMKRLVAAAKDTFAEGATETLGGAGDFIFDLESAGLLHQRKLFSELAARRLIDTPGQFSKSVATVQTALGKGQTGNAREVLSQAFAASGDAPDQAPVLLEAAGGPAAFAKQQGVKLPELLASIAILGKGSKGGADEASTGIRAMLKAFAEDGGFKGLSIKESIEKLKGENLSDQDLIKFFGRVEGQKSFSVLSDETNAQKVADLQAKIESAKKNDLTSKLVEASSDPIVDSQIIARQIRNKAELAKLNRGIESTAAEASQESFVSNLPKHGLVQDFFLPGISDELKKVLVRKAIEAARLNPFATDTADRDAIRGLAPFVNAEDQPGFQNIQDQIGVGRAPGFVTDTIGRLFGVKAQEVIDNQARATEGFRGAAAEARGAAGAFNQVARAMQQMGLQALPNLLRGQQAQAQPVEGG